ncbi:asparaginase [Pseudomonas sp. MTM4]|uniref:asparaginase n=1 Tax=unclassified Pseudomonas TaxID=196821 RepID=UPI0018D22633|nr:MULTISPECIES: asparaginase [unclassified Pseudomonas]MBC8650022.1 asparaginase [Pseudomonas sp. MT4]QXY92353.1 asparaginase [Pseudomonas sp. MTM4]
MTRPEKRLLVLYTGGTIGMQMSDQGLTPSSGFEARLRDRQATDAQVWPDWYFRELLPPIDSASMTQRNWLVMAATIAEEVDAGHCDGVLLLHGTDTLAYSAAALSFLLLGLPVPVVLTGSMLPAGIPDSDAWANLSGALQALREGIRPDVQVYFHGKLMHGARLTKLSATEFDAFAVLPRPRMGQGASGVESALDYRQPRQPVNLAVLPLYPGIQAAQVRAVLASDVQGLVLECYGSGTGPSDDEELLTALREAHARGVVLAAISQCPQGHVEFGIYAAGSKLAASGLVSGGGMTREAALGKLFALLGAGLSQAEVEHWFALNLSGELAD